MVNKDNHYSLVKGGNSVENWVFVDVPHALLQLGYDPLPNWQIN